MHMESNLKLNVESLETDYTLLKNSETLIDLAFISNSGR